MKVSIVIPALNESGSIADVIRACLAHGDEVLVMDGGSTDGTQEIAQKLGARVVFDGGGGKGRAIRRAGIEAKGDVIVFVDADGSHDPADIPRLVEPILSGRADHVTASRLLGGSSELHGGFDEFLRLTGSAFITACINARFRVRLSDSQNGFRAIRRDFLNRLKLISDSTTIEQEMIARTLEVGGRMDEVPSHEHPRKAGKSHVDPVKHAPKYVWSLFRDVGLAKRR